eukprot:scaffold627_cov125-Cylindrotheca_fusiformis.AAC.24
MVFRDKADLSRRNLLASSSTMAAAALFIDPLDANAAIDGLFSYEDPEYKFSLLLPTGWDKSEQSLPGRRKIVLYIKPGSERQTLVFLAFTPVRADFTSLGSFGSADDVAYGTILPKSTLAGIEGVESKMLSAESKKSAYFFDYYQRSPGQPKTHFRTIFTLAKGTTEMAGSILVTITAQTPESQYDEMKPLFDEIIGSFKLKG